MADYIFVQNARGTSRRRACGCGTWIDHWYNETGSLRVTCAALGCSATATVGAHVRDVSRSRAKPRHWIVPTCHHCNMTRDELAIKIEVDLVSANTQIMKCYRPR